MAKTITQKATAKKTPQRPAHRMRPMTDFISGAILLTIAYVLGSLAIDSGSMLQWGGTIVALVWGITRLVQGVYSALTKK